MTTPARRGAQVLTGVALGALVWVLSVPMTGRVEPFDAESHYYLAAMFFSGVAASLWSPRSAWLAVASLFIGERLYVLLALPGLRSTWLLGWLVNAVIPTWWSAAVGALLVHLVAIAREVCAERR